MSTSPVTKRKNNKETFVFACMFFFHHEVKAEVLESPTNEARFSHQEMTAFLETLMFTFRCMKELRCHAFFFSKCEIYK
jgi:hypothetical protein